MSEKDRKDYGEMVNARVVQNVLEHQGKGDKWENSTQGYNS